MFTEKFDKAQEEAGVAPTSKYFKFKEGKNRFRVLAGGEVVAYHRLNGKQVACYGIRDGCPHHKTGSDKASMKTVVYVLNKTNPVHQIQIAEFPWGVAKAIDSLRESDGWEFEELPMPYDIIVTAKNAGTLEVDYQVAPHPDKSPVPDEELAKLAKMKPIAEVNQDKKDFAKKADGNADAPDASEKEINPEAIDF